MDALVTPCSPDRATSTPRRWASRLPRRWIGWRRCSSSGGEVSCHRPASTTTSAGRAPTFATLSRVEPTSVAIGATVSELVGVVAASLPDGARVVIARDEFTSLLFPFRLHRSG